MTLYKRGDIVVVPFPFADSNEVKKRPALVISNNAVNKTGDYILVQITTKEKNDGLSLQIHSDFFAESPLALKSFVRCHKIFLLNQNLILYKKTSVQNSFLDTIIQKIISLIK